MFHHETGPFQGDYGHNHLATQTWFDGRRRIQIAWMPRGGRYRHMPFNQQLTFPRELTLKSTNKGPMLFKSPVLEIASNQLRVDVPVRLGQTRVAVAAAPTSFSLALARPNPFNPSTTISYEVPEQTHVTLTIYNLLGQEVVRLMDQVQAAGRYEVVWHGVNSRGAGVASGVYLYRIVSVSGYTAAKRMTLLK
jgi:hypothetical protein